MSFDSCSIKYWKPKHHKHNLFLSCPDQKDSWRPWCRPPAIIEHTHQVEVIPLIDLCQSDGIKLRPELQSSIKSQWLSSGIWQCGSVWGLLWQWMQVKYFCNLVSNCSLSFTEALAKLFFFFFFPCVFRAEDGLQAWLHVTSLDWQPVAGWSFPVSSW